MRVSAFFLFGTFSLTQGCQKLAQMRRVLSSPNWFHLSFKCCSQLDPYPDHLFYSHHVVFLLTVEALDVFNTLSLDERQSILQRFFLYPTNYCCFFAYYIKLLMLFFVNNIVINDVTVVSCIIVILDCFCGRLLWRSLSHIDCSVVLFKTLLSLSALNCEVLELHLKTV